MFEVDPNGLELTSGFAPQVETHSEVPQNTWQIWKLEPAKTGGGPTSQHLSSGTLEPVSPPSYEGDMGQSSTSAQRTELETDELGTVVNEVTVVTTTVTTRKRYRVEDS